MIEGIIKSYVFGVTLAAAVGPIALLIINYGMTAGLRPAAAAGLGAAMADLSYALVAFATGQVVLARLAAHERALRSASAVVLVLLGLYVILRALRATAPSAARGDVSRPLATTFMLTLVNPMTIVVFATFAAQLPLAASKIAVLPLALSVSLGSLTVSLLFAAGAATLSRFLSRPSRIRSINILSGTAISTFGLVGLLSVR